MVDTYTPVCEFGLKAGEFSLPGVDNRVWTLEDLQGERGILLIFICNHCPFVKAVINKIVLTANTLSDYGINTAAIMPNDVSKYSDDSFENMISFAKEHNFTFPYLYDETQEVAKSYGAVCTPDFFGYNHNLELQYRGRLDASRMDPEAPPSKNELEEAMIQVANRGQGPKEQTPSIGCSIKWK